MPTSPASAATTKPHLVVDALAAGYGGPPVVSEISLTVAPGEVVALIGPNGAGKSTVLKAVAGILPVTAGSVHLGGQSVASLRAEQRARQGLGYVPQTKDVFALLTVRENLEMGGYLLDRTTMLRRIDEVITIFPVLARLVKRKAHQLSGGERKMLAIARALMSSPSTLLLDEPTANLSPELGERVLDESLGTLAASGVAVLVVEQRAIAALHASDRGYVLSGGRVRTSGSSEDLLASGDVGEVFLGSVGSRLIDAIAHE
jgi:ABC-type branched-subunit amino acid transport system ATPase component